MTSDAIAYVLRHSMIEVIHLHSVDFIQCLIRTLLVSPSAQTLLTRS